MVFFNKTAQTCPNTLQEELLKHLPKELYDSLMQKQLVTGDACFMGECEYEGQGMNCNFEFIYNDKETPGVTLMLSVGDLLMQCCFVDQVWYMNHLTGLDQIEETFCEGAVEFIHKISADFNKNLEDAYESAWSLDERRALTPEKTEQTVTLLRDLDFSLTPVSSVCSTPQNRG